MRISPEIIDLPKFLDRRGNLSVIEQGQHIPFDIARTYWVYDVPGGEKRGGHAYQFPEKLIPLFINNIRHGKSLPVYGKGENVRDWLYVEDHARAIDVIFHQGKIGDTYNIGGFNEWKNIDIVKVVIKTVRWYLDNQEWMDNITSGAYEKYYSEMYLN